MGEGEDPQLKQQKQQQEQQAGTEELMRLSEALEEVDALRVSVQSRDAALQAQVSIPDRFIFFVQKRRLTTHSIR